MGQYHWPVSLTKHEFINPHGVGAGLKLWEQFASQVSTGPVLLGLLACSNGRGGGDLTTDDFEGERVVGRWTGDRIAVVGDYSEADDIPGERADLIYDLLSHENQYHASRAKRKYGRQYRPDDLAYQRQVEADAQALWKMEPYRDITHLARWLLERTLGIRFKPAPWDPPGDFSGWLHYERNPGASFSILEEEKPAVAMSPDLVIGRL